MSYRTICFAALLASLLAARAADRLPAAHTPRVRAVVENNYIPVRLDGQVQVGFFDARALCMQDDVLGRVQETYARLLPPGQKPEFVVRQEAADRWSYVNQHRQRSVIVELHRDASRPGVIELLYHVEGTRFFGEFESLIHVLIEDADAESCRYEAQVYAYPKVGVYRFLARHLGLIERYFNGKSGEIAELAVRICQALARPAAETAMQ